MPGSEKLLNKCWVHSFFHSFYKHELWSPGGVFICLLSCLLAILTKSLYKWCLAPIRWLDFLSYPSSAQWARIKGSQTWTGPLKMTRSQLPRKIPPKCCECVWTCPASSSSDNSARRLFLILSWNQSAHSFSLLLQEIQQGWGTGRQHRIILTPLPIGNPLNIGRQSPSSLILLFSTSPVS